jgi:hypothetical protein
MNCKGVLEIERTVKIMWRRERGKARKGVREQEL